MLALRYLHLLTLAIWLGGMVALGALAAPVTFEILQAQAPSHGRTLAGAVFGEMLRRFHPLAYAAGLLLILTLLGMRILGPKPLGFGLRVGIVAVTLMISLYSGLVVSRRIERLQVEIGVPASSLPATDDRRAQFGRLHGLSTGLMLTNVVGALVLLYWPAHE